MSEPGAAMSEPGAPMSGPGALEVEDLWKGYGSTEVLRSVNLNMAAGSLNAVLGLSGCGKTTLLRVIAGFERPQRGRIAVSGRIFDDGHTYVAPERRGIGYVPQEGALFPHLSVQANVGYGLSREQRRGNTVGELLEMVGLVALAKRMPHELSGGEQQRVALARALARRPALLLLDEPFSSLDATLRGTVREEVSTLLRRQGTTTVLVTHDQEEALSLADSVAVLRDGTIVQQGRPAEIYETPSDAQLAGFLGEANLLEAIFEDGWARTVLGKLELSAEPRNHLARTRDRLARSQGDPARTQGDPARTQGDPARTQGDPARTQGDPARTQGDPARTQDRSAGAHGLVVVRPEQLHVRLQTENGEGVRGTVERCRYYGHDALLYIRPADPSRTPRLLARVHGKQALATGTPVLVEARGAVSAVEG